jgi:hypothetical protein
MSEPREITERYRLEKILKSSRSGNVLQATDSTSGRPVVIKTIAMGPPLPGEAPGASGMARLERLAAILGDRPAPCFPAVLDAGSTTDGEAFLVLEHLEGRGFESLSGGRGQRVLHLMGQVIDGLETLAGRGLFHGSLSPDNLLVIRPQADGVKTFGLGTAFFRTPEAAAADAQNARFRAPEELGPASGALPDEERWRSDLYSLALTACRVLGAEVTFAGTPAPKVAIPTVLGFELKQPDALRQILEGALRQRPKDRPTLHQAQNGLRRAQGLPPLAEAPAPPPPLPKAAEPLRPAIEETRPAFFPPEPEPAAAIPAAAPAGGTVDMGNIGEMGGALDFDPLPPLAAAAPPVPEDPGAGLLSFDDDLLGDLPPAAPPAAAAPGRSGPTPRTGGTGPIPTAPSAPVADGKASWMPRFRRPIPLAAAGGGLLVLLLGVWWLVGGGSPPPPVATVPVRPAVPVPPPPPPPGVRLATAKSYMAQGQEHEALAVLRTLTPADQSTLPPPDAQALRTLQATLTQNAPVRVANDLAAGLKGKDVMLLHGAVEDAASLPPTALVPSVQGDLAKARPVAELYDRAAAADRQGQPAEVLGRFGEIAKLLQSGRDASVRDTSGLRDRAAGKLEAEAEALLRDARYDEAVAHLEPLSRTWPDRPGLKARLADVRAQEKAEHSVQTAIAEATAAEKLKKPDDGLAALRRVKPTAHLETPYGEVKQRLETLLAQYDNAPPTVELRDGYLLDYSRGTPVSLSFRVRDDYKVESVKIYARPGSGGKMQEMPYVKDGFTYTVAISPAFHDNQTVDFYVTATDPSGHETFLGTRDKPMQLKRKKGFRET